MKQILFFGHHVTLWLQLVGVTVCEGATMRWAFEVNYFQVDPDGSGDTWIMGINGSVPGPELRVRRGDRLQVDVINKCGTEHVTIHWHGFEMRNAQEYDGAMQITQCGIEPQHSFVYDFVVDEVPGTYLYHEHAHLEHVAARGLFGALIVEEASGVPSLWNYDGEATLLFSDYWRKSNVELERIKQARLIRPNTISALGNGVGLLPFHNLLINGKGVFNVFGSSSLEKGWTARLAQIRPKAGETWRLRLANGGALFAMRFRIDKHRLQIIQTDAADVEPYFCDAITMSSGERFDVLVTFDETPGSYWMRLETLEANGLHHGQLGIVHYADAETFPDPDADKLGYPRRHRLEETPGLVTLGCIDQTDESPTCRPITDLRRHHQFLEAHVGTSSDTTHDFEVSPRGFGAGFSGHFARLLDLAEGPNNYGNDQYAGEFVQFHLPKVPYTHTAGDSRAEHPHSLVMRVALGETVRVIIQTQGREAHPWHLHGHKFAVLAQGFPEYDKTCDVLFCRSEFHHWISRDGFPRLLDVAHAPLKDTVHLPPGGWVVIQFKADNPGWWFFHCHMAVHAHDGMALILAEAVDQVPAQVTNMTYLNERGFPSCKKELAALEKSDGDVACSCWQDPEMKIDDKPRASYKCSQPYLCGHVLGNPLEPSEPILRGVRDRRSGLTWRLCMLLVESLGVLLLFFLKRTLRPIRYAKPAQPNDSSDTRDSHCADFSSDTRDSQCTMNYEEGLAVSIVAKSASFEPIAIKFAPRSLVLILGKPDVTSAWFDLLGGRCQREGQTARIAANVSLGEFHVARYERLLLRRQIAYIPMADTTRPSCLVREVLELYSVLGAGKDWQRDSGARMRHRDKIIETCGIDRFLDESVGSIRPEEWLRLEVAQCLLLQSKFLVLEEPVAKLSSLYTIQFLELLKSLTEAFSLTIAFTSSFLAGKAADLVDYTVLVEDEKAPLCGSNADLRAALAYQGRPVPETSHVLEWCSKLLFDVPEKRTSSKKRFSSMASVLSRASAKMAAGSRAKSLFGDLAPIGEPIKRAAFVKQVWLLFWFEFQCRLHAGVHYFKVVEIFGVGFIAGVVWFGVASRDTQTGLGELVGLLFFTTAFWTIPPLFQALTATKALVARVELEYQRGLYNVLALVTAHLLGWFVTETIWISAWQIIAYTLAELGGSVSTMIFMHIALVLNVSVMHSLGLCLALFVPDAAINVVIANLFGQMCMLTSGFYTKVPAWFFWTTALSVPRYTLTVLLKLEVSWRDAFRSHPMHGNPYHGYPTMYIPAEMTGLFQTMTERQMHVMQSPHDSSILSEIFTLIAITIVCYIVFSIGLLIKVRARQRNRTVFPDDQMVVVPPRWNRNLSCIAESREAFGWNSYDMKPQVLDVAEDTFTI